MRPADLIELLEAIASGDTTPDVVASARAAVRASDLGSALDASTMFADEPAEDARGLLELLEPEPAGLLGSALRAEAHGGDVADDVMAALFDTPSELASAVRDASGDHVDVASALDPAALPMSTAVRASAGPSPEVAASFDPGSPVADAVRADAGAVPELGASFDVGALPLAAALVEAAGVVPDVATAFAPASVALAEAVRSAAGACDVEELVGVRIGWSSIDVSAALVSEAGHATVADAVVEALGLARADAPRAQISRVPPPALPVDEAGAPIWVSALLDHELSPAMHAHAAERVVADATLRVLAGALADAGREVRESVQREAGEAPALWHGVATAIGIAEPEVVVGWDGALFAEAVRSEGQPAPSLADAVLQALEPVTPTVIADPAEVALPAAANAPWPALVALAAAALLLLAVLPRVPSPFEADPEWTERPIELAVAGEINVDELTYGKNASVFVEVPADQETPLIIWVDEGTSL